MKFIKESVLDLSGADFFTLPPSGQGAVNNFFKLFFQKEICLIN